jgi:glycosyltransferase involved in cell wall biosynthesis
MSHAGGEALPRLPRFSCAVQNDAVSVVTGCRGAAMTWTAAYDPLNSSSTGPMHVAVYAPPTIPTSFAVYLARVGDELGRMGVTFERFGGTADLPRQADLVWDIRSGGGNPPPDFLLGGGLPPLVVTIHGFAPLTLAPREYYRGWRERWHARGNVERQHRRWAATQAGIRGVIAVSAYTRDECGRHAGIEPGRITVCHHGVDATSFGLASVARDEATLLHVSNDEPRKNLARVLKAFDRVRRRLPQARLRLKVPAEAAGRYQDLPGVEVIAGHLQTAELAALYARSTGFVFPSLYEGFGLPILEAMAAGCPVLTSDVSACPEVAGEAAICVDPRSIDAIAEGMAQILKSGEGARLLIAAGGRRCQQFTWERSAGMHLCAFRKALGAENC